MLRLIFMRLVHSQPSTHPPTHYQPGQSCTERAAEPNSALNSTRIAVCESSVADAVPEHYDAAC
jgi:hypothetical protein